MREIKFRAFNKAERKMCRVVSIDFTGFITVRFPEFEHESDDYNDQMSIEEFEPLMQFTGLKDKNGKEIYEGDIIKGTYYDNLYKTKKEVICQVRWDKSGYWTFSGAINFSGGYLSDLRNVIVIGNIYENPELLEVEGK